MILAAGRGERMRPLSDAVPKPALPLPGGPLIASALRLAANAGYEQVVVNAWHLAPVLKRVCRTCTPENLSIEISEEPERLGTAGGLAFARESGLLGEDGPVLVMNADCALNLDLEPLFERHTRADDLVTFALLPHLDPLRWSRVVLDKDGTVEDIRAVGRPEKGEVPLLHSGIMLVAREALDELAVECSSVREALFPKARDEGRLGGAVVTGHWREIGTPETYLDAVLSLLGYRAVVENDAKVERGVLVKRSLIAAGARVETGAKVSRSIIAYGAVVKTGAEVSRSVVLGECRVNAGENLEDVFRVEKPPE
jgi:NDP-sugar pyrophosphorylase family protein